MKRVKNIISYLLVLAGFGVMFGLFPSYFLGLMIVFLIFLGIYDGIGLIFLVKKVNIKLKLPKEPMIKKNKVSILVDVWNPTIFFTGDVTLKVKICNDFYGESTEVFFHIPVYGKEKGTISLPIEFQHCGKVRMVLEEVKILGILGILKLKKKMEWKEDSLYIYPKEMDWQESMKRREGFYGKIQDRSSETEKKGSDFVEVSDIREYIPGDKIRDIHWKLSAKKEILMVKEHVNMSDTRQIILLELKEDDKTEYSKTKDNKTKQIEEEHCVMEEVLEFSIEVMKNFLAQGMAFEIFWWNENEKTIFSKEVQNLRDISKVMELILEAKVYQENKQLEKLWKSQSHDGTNYVWIGKEEETMEYKVIAKGALGVIAKWEG